MRLDRQLCTCGDSARDHAGDGGHCLVRRATGAHCSCTAYESRPPERAGMCGRCGHSSGLHDQGACRGTFLEDGQEGQCDCRAYTREEIGEDKPRHIPAKERGITTTLPLAMHLEFTGVQGQVEGLIGGITKSEFTRALIAIGLRECCAGDLAAAIQLEREGRGV